MGCCFNFTSSPSKSHYSTNSSMHSAPPPPPPPVYQPQNTSSSSRNLRQETLLQIPGCKVYLMEGGEAIELANGHFALVKISDEDVSLATIVKVGGDLQWPLTKDEPVVKISSSQYLFSLPMRGEAPLSYGVSFGAPGMNVSVSSLAFLDSFLQEHSCFSSSSSSSKSNNIDWREFAPRIDDYNNILARAIAGGTGQIVRGIFLCSNAYTNQVQKGGEMIQSRAIETRNGVPARDGQNASKKSAVNTSLKRVRKLSKTTEKLSKSMLDGVGLVTGSIMKPAVQSKAGKSFLSMVPGEVLLASLDAVNKILDAAEAAEKQTLSATSGAATRMVSDRFGENAGEATGDVLATAGHCAGTAWNVFKIRKAINPASSVSTGVLKNAAKNANKNSH